MRSVFLFIQFLCLTCILLLASFSAFCQATPVNNVANPYHQSLDQQTITVNFNGGPLTGTTSISQWTVTINGVPVNVIGVSNTEVGGYNTSITATAYVVNVKFDASGIAALPSHPAYILKGDVVTISFANSSNTLLTSGSLLPIADFGPFTSKNYFLPGATGASDIIFSGQNLASGANRDQCSPVNTSFQTWTYLYSLRYYNSSYWSTATNKLRVSWGYSTDQTDIPGYLSNSAGVPSAATPVASFTGGNPGVFLSFRSGLNTSSFVLDGSNGYSYPDNTGVCNFRATYFPIGTGTATYNSSIISALKKDTQFDSFDYDDQNTGQLILNPTVTATDRVCLGSDVGLTYTNLTDLNCNGTGDLDVPPQRKQYACQYRHALGTFYLWYA
jgi:hypothetical protein